MSFDPSAQQRYAPAQGYRDQPASYEEKAGLTGAGAESYRESLLSCYCLGSTRLPSITLFRVTIPKLWDSKRRTLHRLALWTLRRTPPPFLAARHKTPLRTSRALGHLRLH